MGAQTFVEESTSSTAREAFMNAVDEAAYEHGHGGYTGTIAEKDEFVMIPLPAETNPVDYADKLLSAADPRVDDKWGPAGCIDCGDSKYLFFGWASC